MRLFLVGLILSCFSFCFSQKEQTDSLVVDTVKVHSPKKAVILSAIVPGAGQIYNHLAMPKGKKKAYWKVPLIYSGLGIAGYFLISNQVTQKDLKLDYTNRINGGIPDPRWEVYDDQAILTLYNRHLDWRDLSILGMGAVYLFQLVDAGIEAHFVDFDISEDLSLQIDPAYFGNRTAGLSLSFNFR